MHDIAELFPGLDFGTGPRSGGCVAPIGTRGRSHRRVTRPRPPSPTALLLAELRKLAPMLAHITVTLRRLEHELAANTRERRATNEAIGRLARQHVELRRDLGRTELHIPAQHSRQRPLGHD